MNEICYEYPSVMPLSKVIAAVGVNLVVPFLGVTAFVLLCRWMWRAQIESPPFFSFFILFATFGGWLMVLLTALFWEWSGMASLGVCFLAFVAPFVTAVLAWSLRQRRALSAFHKSAFYLSVGYSGMMFPLVLCWIGWAGLYVR
jgi:hypothetical protein